MSLTINDLWKKHAEEHHVEENGERAFQQERCAFYIGALAALTVIHGNEGEEPTSLRDVVERLEALATDLRDCSHAVKADAEWLEGDAA
jgi:hypothetical protein